MSNKNMVSLYGIDDEHAYDMENKRKEIITSISELSPVKQQQVIKLLDELIKMTISACHK